MFDSREPIGTVEKKGYQLWLRKKKPTRKPCAHPRSGGDRSTWVRPLANLHWIDFLRSWKASPRSKSSIFPCASRYCLAGGPHLAPIARPLQ